MLYTTNTIKAMRLAYEAHKEQYDKSGVPYIFHPIHLAEQLENEVEICVALLHDTVEDNEEINMSTLYEWGFSQEIIEIVDTLTRKQGEKYMDYINRIKNNPIAKKIKLIDIKHNRDLNRWFNELTWAKTYTEKYEKALKILEG